MVVRYPHTATVKIITTVIASGEYSSESETTQDIAGRLEYSALRVEKADGQYTDLKGTFFTIVKPIEGACKLTVNDVTYSIIRWIEYQNYCEIWLE